MSIQALREQRAAKAIALHELCAKSDWKADRDAGPADALQNEVLALDEQIKFINASNALLAEQAVTHGMIEAGERAAVNHKSEGSRVYAAWLRNGYDGLSHEDKAIYNTMSTTTNSQGGYTVQTEVAREVLDALKAFGGMRAVSNVIQTTGVGDLNYPTSDGTAETGELVAQNASATGADVSFGVKALTVYKFSSKVVAVPFELLQDSNVDIEAFVRQRLVTRLGRSTNSYFTTGTGSSQPNGVVTAASVGVTAANSTSQVTAITYDSLVDLEHSVDPAYRALGNTKWMMNDASVKVLRKIKDGQSRPIFVPGYDQTVPGGAPDMLMGKPIVINQDVAVMAAGATSILYGDFSFYTIRDAMAVEMFRFTDSTYTKAGQVGFLAWMRSGGNLIDVGGAVKAFVNAAS